MEIKRQTLYLYQYIYFYFFVGKSLRQVFQLYYSFSSIFYFPLFLFVALKILITQFSHFKRDLAKDRFTVGLLIITVIHNDAYFLHACPANFSLLNDIFFVTDDIDTLPTEKFWHLHSCIARNNTPLKNDSLLVF